MVFGVVFALAVPVGVALIFLGLREPDKLQSRVEIAGAVLAWPRLLHLAVSEIVNALAEGRLRRLARYAWAVPLYWIVEGYAAAFLLTGGKLWPELQVSLLVFATIVWYLAALLVVKTLDFFVAH